MYRARLIVDLNNRHLISVCTQVEVVIDNPIFTKYLHTERRVTILGNLLVEKNIKIESYYLHSKNYFSITGLSQGKLTACTGP